MLETLEKREGRFIVLGFDDSQTGQDGRARVLGKDGSSAWVPITRNDQLIIDGKKYDRKQWNH